MKQKNPYMTLYGFLILNIVLNDIIESIMNIVINV